MPVSVSLADRHRSRRENLLRFFFAQVCGQRGCSPGTTKLGNVKTLRLASRNAHPAARAKNLLADTRDQSI